jgi:hypothetical protein
MRMGSSDTARVPLSEGERLQLGRWNAPTIYNGWEQITQHDASREGFNLDEVCDFQRERRREVPTPGRMGWLA